MDADSPATSAVDRAASGISSTVTWIPDLDPARRRALGEAVVALRLAHTDPIPPRSDAEDGSMEDPLAQAQ